MHQNASAQLEGAQIRPAIPSPALHLAAAPALPGPDWQHDWDSHQRALAWEALAEAGRDVDPGQLVNLARTLDRLA